MSDLRAAIIGLGFVGRAHAEALHRIGIPIRGVLESTPAMTQAAAQTAHAEHAYEDVEALTQDEAISVVHICTPNVLHHRLAHAALAAGKHVICEKPLAMNSQETAELMAMAEDANLVGAVTYNLRYYPLCQQAKAMVEEGQIGEPRLIHGSYLQDWLFYPQDWNWRLDPDLGGAQRAVGDIGTHWLDLAMWLTGRRITEVFADIATVVLTRQRPLREVETFESKLTTADQVEEVAIQTEDYASILIHFEGNAHGVLTVSQVSAGRKNRMWIEVDGSSGSLAWNAESPNQLWVGYRDRSNETMLKDPALMSASARPYAGFPGGHAEGYPDTFVQFFKDVYTYISGGDYRAPRPFPTFHAGHEGVCLCEAVATSVEQGRWVKPIC